jgi:predicted DNA-binding protein
MPKPNRRKTDTIKERAIYVYLPSVEMAERWKRRAEKAGVSISKFVIERVEDSIRREEGEEGYLSRAELIKRLREAEEEIKS